MSWLDSYRTASFRGIEFKVEGHDAQFGRRKVTHEYPGRDKPFTEDLGRKAREFSVDAYVLGDDYAAARDQLITACESDGVGELVHPYLGNLQVECMGLRVREMSREGRICYMQITFVEAGEAEFPSDEVDSVKAVTSSANDAMEASRDGFLGRFSVDGLPSFVADAAAAKLGEFSDLMANLPINPMAGSQSVADFMLRVRSIKGQALRLINQPRELANSILGIVSSIRDVFGTRADTVLRTMRSQNQAPYVGPTNTPNRRQEKENDEAFSALIRQTAIAEQAKDAAVRASDSADAVAADRDDTEQSDLYQTRDEAIAVRDEITDALDAEMEDSATDALMFQAFTALRTEVVRGVPAPTLRLPSIVEVTPPATTPSLVVAYGFYGDAGRAMEIAQRNRAPHPGFLAGGRPLEVITDA